MDGSMPGRPPGPQTMQAIVIGGAANGVIIPSMLIDATVIELGRPDYVKPLERSTQAQPDVEMEKDRYDVCTIFLSDSENNPIPFGICVLQGKPMVWAFSELVKGFAQNVINQSKENLKL